MKLTNWPVNQRGWPRGAVPRRMRRPRKGVPGRGCRVKSVEHSRRPPFPHQELGRRLHRPAVFRIPDVLLRRVGGDFANELLLGGQRVLPNKALSNGFVFRHETLRSAFEAIL